MVILYPNTDAWELKVQNTKQEGAYKCFVIGGSVEVSISKEERIFLLRNEKGEILIKKKLPLHSNHIETTRDFAQWADDLEFDIYL